MRFVSGAVVSAVLLAGFGGLWVGESRGASERRFINLPDRTDDNPYSNAVLVGDTLYLAGDIGIDPATGAPPPKIEDEVRLVMESMKARLEMVGMSMEDLVTVEVHCSDLSLYDEFNSVYRTYFTDHFPARAFLGSGPLLLGGHFEVTGVAVRR
jgi:enamine deaminase RidA (YjgF/YER057c/UK114 family)